MIDIDELDDRAGRVVGFVYTTSAGERFLQGTWLMSIASQQRLRLRFLLGTTSEPVAFDGGETGLAIRPCRPSFVMPSSIPDLRQRLAAANYSGFDVLPKGRERYYLDVYTKQFAGRAPAGPPEPGR